MFEKMTILQLRKMLDEGKCTSVELTNYFLERIKQDKTNAFISVFEETAISEAQNADRLISKGKATNLTGIPVAVKDNILTKDSLTTCASKMLSDFFSPCDATAVARLRRQGAVIIGKTNMDEFGMGSHTQNSYFGGTKNPIDTARSPGGSSGGSAAAVSAGLVPYALGSDTGGSVRQPASYCGIVGLKPTYGRVSRNGLIAYASSLDQIGVMTKCVADASVVLEAIAGEDICDPTTAQGKFVRDKISFRKKTVGVIRELLDCADEETAEAVRKAASFYENEGLKVVNVSLPSIRYAICAYYIIAAAEASANLSRYDGVRFGYKSADAESYEKWIRNNRSDGFGEEVKKRILFGNLMLSEENYEKYYKKALFARAQIRKEYEEIFDKCDILISPGTPSAAPLIGEKGGYADDVCTVPVSLAGLPSVSIPCTKNKDGLPMGIALTARHFEESLLFEAAETYERGLCLS